MTIAADRVAVEVSDATGAAASARPEDSSIEAWVQAALVTVGIPGRGAVEVAVLIADTGTVRQMNHDYRGKDKPTNVLSFPVGDLEGLPGEAAVPLGDIVLCPEVIAGEAAEQGKSPDDHWAHLCVHGALHLAGFDHDDDAEAAEMEALEVQILAELGVSDPYVGG